MRKEGVIDEKKFGKSIIYQNQILNNQVRKVIPLVIYVYLRLDIKVDGQKIDQTTYFRNEVFQSANGKKLRKGEKTYIPVELGNKW